jgi:hypothetical protein
MGIFSLPTMNSMLEIMPQCASQTQGTTFCWFLPHISTPLIMHNVKNFLFVCGWFHAALARIHDLNFQMDSWHALGLCCKFQWFPSRCSQPCPLSCSSNGTFVNQQKLLRSGLEVELWHGDIVSLGGPPEHGEALHPICICHYIHELFCIHGHTN